MPSIGDNVVMLTENTALVEQFGAEVGFRAAFSSTVDRKLAPGEQIVTVKFDSVKRDNPSGSFDTDFGVWTVPEDGVYIVTAGVEFGNAENPQDDAGKYTEMALLLDKQDGQGKRFIASSQGPLTGAGNSDQSNDTHRDISGSFELKEGWELNVRVRADPDNNGYIKFKGQSPDDNYFTGTKVADIP